MYIPKPFRVDDPATLRDFIGRHAFATLVTATDDGPLATHVPLLLDSDAGEHGTLLGHMARPNPHSRRFDTSSASLAIFRGPHAYISPAWYVDGPAVPTWNYAVVHAYGHPRVIDDDARVTAILDDLIDVYESGELTPWRAQLPDDFRARMQRGIVAFEMPITRVEGKFKLGQNRSREDQLSAQRHVAQQPDPDSGALAEFWSGLLAQTETS